MLTQLLPGLHAISVPEDAHSFEKCVNDLFFKSDFVIFKDIGHMSLIGFDFTILGTCTATEVDFDCSGIVEMTTENAQGDDYGDKFYWDYINECFDFSNPNMSLRSLITSKGQHFVNPMGEKPKQPTYATKYIWDTYYTKMDKWQSYENHLVKKLLIIKEI